jgi:hypothetical protein
MRTCSINMSHVLGFLFRYRVAVVAALGVFTVGAAVWAFHGASVPVGALFLSTISLVVAAGIAFIHLRHVGLAVTAVLAPLPGMMGAASGFSTATLAVYGAATVAAALVAGDVTRLILTNRERADAAATALTRMAPAVLAAGIVNAVLLAAWLGTAAAVPLMAALVSVLLVVPFVAALLPFGESFFVAANRARDAREPLLRIASHVAEPRWGLSLGGITLVLAVLGWFGAAPLLAHRAALAQPWLWSGSALGLLAVAFAVARDWRDAVAIALGTAALTLLDLWLWGRATGHLTLTAFGEIALTVSAAYLLMLVVSDRRRRHRRQGDESSMARARALEELGAAPWYGAAGAAAAIVPWIVVHGSNATLAAMFVLAAGAAMVAAPALATALETLVPRRRSVEELYGRD